LLISLKFGFNGFSKPHNFALYASILDTFGYKIKSDGFSAPQLPPRPAEYDLCERRGERERRGFIFIK
jgi:hypothetical protein